MRKFLTAFAAVLVSAGIAWSANIPLLSGSQYNEPNQIVATLNALITSINSSITAGGVGSWQTPRNFVDNGAMTVQQRGTAAVTCAANSAATVTAYGADRWLCDANVGSGAGQMQIATATPTPPLGFSAETKLWRNSGALTQPVCAWQAIPTSEAVELQGQQVTLSAYMQALAGLAADNGNAATLVILTGTGTDEKFLGTSWTASPAITPAWTGIATTLSSNVTLTTSWARYQATAFIPNTATEIAVGVCFTPTATGAGATDGFAFTGVQLEQGATAGVYEQRKITDETARAQRYYWALNEPAADVCQGAGYSTSTTAARISIQNPVTMRAAPTVTSVGAALAGTTWKVEDAATPIVLSTPFLATFTANTADFTNLTATTGASQTAGRGVLLCGAGGGGILAISADL